jgi:ATP-dependent DNA helicase RecQ
LKVDFILQVFAQKESAPPSGIEKNHVITIQTQRTATTMPHSKEKALGLLKSMLGEQAVFRAGQWEAINAVVNDLHRVLLIQKTGWGKSVVYFIATRMLRDTGKGPTLLISPLLSLMRDQIRMAEKIGIRALTINSTNPDEWPAIEDALNHNCCDVMLISPERLNNQRFLKHILPKISGHIGMFVIDEAHCISDWGHDFRPDYMRITRILQQLPAIIPVLGTTATANNRVIADIQSQLGKDLMVMRGPLARRGLRLQNLRLGSAEERLAWLVENLPKFGNARGIIYCLTVKDTERVAEWLKQQGFNAEGYSAKLDGDKREQLEMAFKNNQLDIIVATVALGMGFDKPDVHFVIHYQCPGSVVHYYQQVGRAGRSLEKSYGVLLGGHEDEAIQDYFIKTAFPSDQVMHSILKCLEKSDGLSKNALISQVNVSFNVLEQALKLLELEQAVGIADQGRMVYFRTPHPWQPDTKRTERITQLRRGEVREMQTYLDNEGCLMAFLQKTLNDPHPNPCGICANCTKRGFSPHVNPQIVSEAAKYLKDESIEILPRRRWPQGCMPPGSGWRISAEHQNKIGRVLTHYNDGLWGQLVREGKYIHGHFSDELVGASAKLIASIWQPKPFPTWVTAIPSQRHSNLVPDFACALAKALQIPYLNVFERVKAPPEQKGMSNSFYQARNVLSSLKLKGTINPGPVLLVDDIVDSRWTLTVAGYLLLINESGPVFPFTLAQATGKGTN